MQSLHHRTTRFSKRKEQKTIITKKKSTMQLTTHDIAMLRNRSSSINLLTITNLDPSSRFTHPVKIHECTVNRVIR